MGTDRYEEIIKPTTAFTSPLSHVMRPSTLALTAKHRKNTETGRGEKEKGTPLLFITLLSFLAKAFSGVYYTPGLASFPPANACGEGRGMGKRRRLETPSLWPSASTRYPSADRSRVIDWAERGSPSLVLLACLLRSFLSTPSLSSWAWAVGLYIWVSTVYIGMNGRERAFCSSRRFCCFCWTAGWQTEIKKLLGLVLE